MDVLDRSCVQECPVDCIYKGERMLYIHPGECVDCGACEPVCPVEAIYYEDDLPDRWKEYKDENARFFAEALRAGSRRWALRRGREAGRGGCGHPVRRRPCATRVAGAGGQVLRR